MRGVHNDRSLFIFEQIERGVAHITALAGASVLVFSESESPPWEGPIEVCTRPYLQEEKITAFVVAYITIYQILRAHY